LEDAGDGEVAGVHEAAVARAGQQVHSTRHHVQVAVAREVRDDEGGTGGDAGNEALQVLYDPDFTGTLFMEELENGVHPIRLRRLVQEIRDFVGDPTRGDTNLCQVITNSHSPVVLSVVRERDAEAFLSDVVIRKTADQEVRRTRIRPVKDSDQARLDETGDTVSRAEVERILQTVTGGA